MNKRKRLLLLLLLLLLLVAVPASYFLFKPQPVAPMPVTLQGETELSAGSIVMKVWDREAEDGDVVQVYFNGKLLAKSLAILNEPVEYKLGKISRGTYLLEVRALDEGSTSPASTTVSLNDGKVEKDFSMDAWITHAASWKVIVK